jgi:hypothetical protein
MLLSSFQHCQNLTGNCRGRLWGEGLCVWVEVVCGRCVTPPGRAIKDLYRAIKDLYRAIKDVTNNIDLDVVLGTCVK